MILPKPSTSAKLFLTGSTVGPLVDALHNQCLLEYDILPIAISLPGSSSETAPLLCTSWLIPPLLGVAYVVLGGILPRLFSLIVGNDGVGPTKLVEMNGTQLPPRERALAAVMSTALIIRLSEYLQTHSHMQYGNLNIAIMVAAAAAQWITLDGTYTALIAAIVTAFGGPLSELPFVAAGCWHYIPQAADYLPLSGLGSTGTNTYSDLSQLALSSITGPCYFAVTMDSIALGRWFDNDDDVDDDSSGDVQKRKSIF